LLGCDFVWNHVGAGASCGAMAESRNAESVVCEDAVGDCDVLAAEVAEGPKLCASIHGVV
jgi:hypothetical protein